MLSFCSMYRPAWEKRQCLDTGPGWLLEDWRKIGTAIDMKFDVAFP